MSKSISPHLRILSDKLPLDILKYAIESFLLPAKRKLDIWDKSAFDREIRTATLCGSCGDFTPSVAARKSFVVHDEAHDIQRLCKDCFMISLELDEEDSPELKLRSPLEREAEWKAYLVRDAEPYMAWKWKDWSNQWLRLISQDPGFEDRSSNDYDYLTEEDVCKQNDW